jgi:protein-disulfide isomerase
MNRSTRTPHLLVSLLCALPLVLPVGCMGKRRPDAERQKATTAAQKSPGGERAALVQVEDVDDTLSHLVDGDRVRVPYDAGDPQKGAAAPLVTIVEFSDFQCPFCGRLAEALDEVAGAYPDDVRLVFKQFPLPMHADAEPGARATLAAHAQGKFWPMHDALFTNPRAMSRDDLMAHARTLGLDMERFEADLDAPAQRERVAADMRLGKQLEVSSTPTFFVNGKKHEGALPAEQIKRIVEEERAKALALVDAGSRREEVYARIMRAAAQGKGEAPPPTEADHERGAPSKRTNYAVPIGKDSPTRGPADALVTVIEFGGFDCDGCKDLAKVIDEVAAQHPDVRFVSRQYSSDDDAAALVALAAARQGKFWPTRQRLLEAGRIELGAAPRLAAELGLQARALTRDLEGDAVKTQLRIDRNVASKFGGTAKGPFAFVNGRFLGPKATAQDFQALIREESEKAQAFMAEQRVAKADLFETMRKSWRGYEVAQQAEQAAVDPVAPSDRTAMSTEGLPVKGDPAKAKVSIVECSDFDCGFCARVSPTLEQIIETYGNDVAIYFRQFPLPMHPAAEPAHRAALAAHAQGKFWEMHDRLFADRSARDENKLSEIAGELGLDVARWRRDFASPAIKEQLERDLDACRNAGVSGTPAFFINGRSLVGAQPFEQFAAMIDEELGR